MSRFIERYNKSERTNHWLVALLFVLAGLSGLAFFHPSLFFLSNLFGGGSWARILHPFMGLLMVVFFFGMYLRYKNENKAAPGDKEWNAKRGEMLRGDKSNMPPVGKYNPGQKMVFWLMVWCLLVLLITGFMFWRPWFAGSLPIDLVRLASVLHAMAAVGLILGVIMHVYAAIWVKGTIRAMTRGTVTESWAKANHKLWYDEQVAKGGPGK